MKCEHKRDRWCMTLNLSLGACECMYVSEFLCAIMGRGMRESEHE